MSNIPKGRKAAYYIGIAMIALGFILLFLYLFQWQAI